LWKDVTHMPLPVFVRRLLLIAWDVASWLLAFLMFAWLRYKDSLTHEQWVGGVMYTAIAIVLQVVGGLGYPNLSGPQPGG